VEAEEQICSKDMLVHAAWPPEEDKAGVTGDALREAMRRLKVELGDEMKDRIKTVHNQGYRLQTPDRGVTS
jgi:DNA-binding winged helix-turn-helix (wHTH) protein